MRCQPPFETCMFLMQTLNIVPVLVSCLQEYKDSMREAEVEVKRLNEENDLLEKSSRMEKGKRKNLKQQLKVELLTGTSFLKSERGKRHVVTLERQARKSAVEDFKRSVEFNELVMDRAVSVYDDAVRKCQRLLRKSGRVSEDIIQLIDLQDSHQEERRS